MPVTDSEATVLVVDDEPLLTEAYVHWLDDEYSVRSATDGEQALAELDGTVDVVLLDRQMPNLSGEETLERIREQSYSCRVAMVTAEEPDFDILQMEFDKYLVKPVTKDDLTATVEELLALSTYDDQVQEVVVLAEKRAAIETATNESDRRENEQFAALTDRLREARADLDDAIEGAGEAGLTGTFGDFQSS